MRRSLVLRRTCRLLFRSTFHSRPALRLAVCSTAPLRDSNRMSGVAGESLPRSRPVSSDRFRGEPCRGGARLISREPTLRSSRAHGGEGEGPPVERTQKRTLARFVFLRSPTFRAKISAGARTKPDPARSEKGIFSLRAKASVSRIALYGASPSRRGSPRLSAHCTVPFACAQFRCSPTIRPLPSRSRTRPSPDFIQKNLVRLLLIMLVL